MNFNSKRELVYKPGDVANTTAKARVIKIKVFDSIFERPKKD